MRFTYKHENRGLIYSVKNILAMHNIDCHIKNNFGHTMGAEFRIDNTLLELWVKNDEDDNRAREVIEQELEGPQERKSWAYKNYGKENAGQFALCWSCQTVVEER